MRAEGAQNGFPLGVSVPLWFKLFLPASLHLHFFSAFAIAAAVEAS